MLFYFHSVFWHAIDVVVILHVTPSMPFHCPCLQYHFLYLPLRHRQTGRQTGKTDRQMDRQMNGQEYWEGLL